jgi:hypothetical protein
MWTWRHRLALVCCLSYLGIQLAVPALMLASPRPARFGWQMFSARVSFPRFLLLMSDGSRVAPDLNTYVARTRGDMDLGRTLPPYLCRVVPGVRAVEVTVPPDNAVSLHPCP